MKIYIYVSTSSEPLQFYSPQEMEWMIVIRLLTESDLIQVHFIVCVCVQVEGEGMQESRLMRSLLEKMHDPAGILF